MHGTRAIGIVEADAAHASQKAAQLDERPQAAGDALLRNADFLFLEGAKELKRDRTTDTGPTKSGHAPSHTNITQQHHVKGKKVRNGAVNGRPGQPYYIHTCMRQR